jgi:hypothetical protein
LRKANNRISNAIAKPSIFRHYDIGDALHSSSDGQKFETSIHTRNACHSPKYFGLKKGVVFLHSVDRLLAKLFDSLVTVCGADQFEAFRLDRSAERIEHRAIIIDEEDPGFVMAGGVAGTCGSWRSRRANVLRYQAFPAALRA